MGSRRMARDRCNGRRAGAIRSSWPDENSVPDYERGCTWAGRLFCAMFAVLTVGCWWFGW